MEKTCEFCGVTFQAKSSKQRFCSKKCSNSSLSKKIRCNCDNCGKEIYRKRDEYEKRNHHFCSQKCKKEFGRIECICKQCGTKFESLKNRPGVFCCADCRNQYMAKHQKTNREIIICEQCGIEFEDVVSAERRFCSEECKYKWLSLHFKESDLMKRHKQRGMKTFEESLQKEYQTIEPLEEYVTATTPIKCTCKIHGGEFYMTPVKINTGQNSCRYCNTYSKGENEVRDYLINNNINYEQQKTYIDLYDVELLRFDFYLPDYNILIEYDGEQHYKAVTYGVLTQEQAENNLKTTQQHDLMKNQYCVDNNIKLIRIPYTKFKAIKDILSKEIA